MVVSLPKEDSVIAILESQTARCCVYTCGGVRGTRHEGNSLKHGQCTESRAALSCKLEDHSQLHNS